MANFLTIKEKKISNDYEKYGFVIKKVKNISELEKMRRLLVGCIKKKLSINKSLKDDKLLNNIHKYLKPNKLNTVRKNLIEIINDNDEFRRLYYQISKEYLDVLLGNELAMQRRVNLSIQLPRDNSSLLPIHSDIWGGNSPFDLVVWVPLVDCYKTKSMYLLPPSKANKINKMFKKSKNNSGENLFKKIKKDLTWVDVKYGEVLIFNQALPHGNVKNLENETRWSLNCRFKSIFSPYNDKKLGEYFEAITLRKVSQIGMQYELPKI